MFNQNQKPARLNEKHTDMRDRAHRSCPVIVLIVRLGWPTPGGSRQSAWLPTPLVSGLPIPKVDQRHLEDMTMPACIFEPRYSRPVTQK